MQRNPNKPGFREAIRNKCFVCCGDMLDGKQDCGITDCPLYHWQPYRKLDTDLAWRTEGSHLQRNRKALRDRYRHQGEEPEVTNTTDFEDEEFADE